MKSISFYKSAFISRCLKYSMINKSRKINRQIVVFESDDWGSIRIPSKEVLNLLSKKDIVFSASNSYDRVDSLESNDDLECLMEVLYSVKDKNNNPAKMTLDTIVANPDFEKIKSNAFDKYYYRPYPETLKKYPNHDRVISLIKDGINNKIFMPQFHGREHLNFQKWLRFLQSGNNDALTCFDYEVYSNFISVGNRLEHVLAAYDIENCEDKYLIKKSIEEGLSLFESIFGFKSKTMIAPCYIWDDYIEEESSKYKIDLMQGGFIQVLSSYEKRNGNNRIGHFYGEKNKYGQFYSIRNCLFEPSQNKKYNSDYCLNQIDRMFKKGFPAIISCHRLNFMGGLDIRNRDVNLRDFLSLLKKITHRYPNVEFMSSDEVIGLY